MELVPGTVIAGRYRLERLLASGGMGTVWVARHMTLGSDVAIKFMHGDPTELTAARSRFEREARTAALIRHPNVVTVQDYGIEGQTPYMAMELLHGENLDDFLLRKKRLTIAELEPIISQISRGLRKAHETGIVHRDLKPSNVFLARDEGDGREVVKILDFGIAKEIDTTLGQHTKTTELMGSPHYMSPEQLRSTKKSDFRSDLWSLGVIIYKALTGVTPFPGDTLAEVMVQVFSGKFTPPSTLVPELPPAIDVFFQRAFARKPDDRFQAIHDMHNAFVAVVAGKPMPAPTAAAPAANPTTTPLPLKTSSPSWPGVVTPPTIASNTPSLPDIAPGPGLSPPAPPEAVLGAGTMVGFGTSSPTINASANWQDNPAPLVAPPEDPQPIAVLPAEPPANPVDHAGFGAKDAAVDMQPPMFNQGLRDASGNLRPQPVVPFEASNPVRPIPSPDAQRKRNIAIAIVGALIILVLGVVLALGGSSDTGDKPRTTENSGGPVVAPPPSGEATGDTTPATAASGSTLTPDEIAAAVPDETPVEVVPNEPTTPVPSTTQTFKNTWKPIPKGQARLKVEAKGGVCKITINAIYYGLTPVDAMVDAGKVRIYCRTTTGSTRSKELRVPENRTTKIEFDIKQ